MSGYKPNNRKIVTIAPVMDSHGRDARATRQPCITYPPRENKRRRNRPRPLISELLAFDPASRSTAFSVVLGQCAPDDHRKDVQDRERNRIANHTQQIA